LIASMGGELRVESTPARGSTFWFVLPFEKARVGVDGIKSELADFGQRAKSQVTGLSEGCEADP